jgi:hypothetical protein
LDVLRRGSSPMRYAERFLNRHRLSVASEGAAIS